MNSGNFSHFLVFYFNGVGLDQGAASHLPFFVTESLLTAVRLNKDIYGA